MAELRLLCLDGGGVRGLASLYMLKQLLSRFGDEKPCHFFDMIAGTSTGGLIAIMLGCLEMTVDECIEAFLRLMGTIFKGGKALPFSLIDGKVKARYSTRVLEEKIRQIITERGLPADARMRRDPDPTCKTFVVALSGAGKTITHFTNYKKADEQSDFYDNVQIWEAARATSAATTFFDPITIDGSIFWDGGAGANNPVNRLWREAIEMFGNDLETRIRCLLSIGTGLPPPSGYGGNVYAITRSLISIATDTQNTHRDFYENHPNLRRSYFRFNPPYLDEIGLDQPEKRAPIRERTEEYGNHEDTMTKRQQFQEAAGGEISRPGALPPPVCNPSRRFYSLNYRPEHIRRNVANYWQHLTLPAYQIYESIVADCQSRSRDKRHVDLSAFLDCFLAERKPAPTRAEAVWRRLLRDPSKFKKSTHSKAFVMACLYMLHVEEAFGNSYGPPNDLSTPIQDRRESLKRYDVWTPCICPRKCGREWNFANDIGICKGGQNKNSCDIQKFLSCGPEINVFSRTANLFNRAASRDLETMKTSWKQPR